jgi:Tfp pilus assembly protein FimT
LKIRTNIFAQGAGGFSLVELLLTLVLILCLAAASVFTFTAIYKSANLDEGLDRFQSLIRFAQAEAATTGRKVRLQFVPGSAFPTEAGTELRTIKVTWEADLLNAPGVFQEYTNKAWSEEIVNELVGVEKVQPIQSPNALSAHESNVEPSTETGDEMALEEEFPSITFYPDGSCDSAEIVLASRNSDDERRLAVRLSGLLGSVSSRTLGSDETDTGEESLGNEEGAYEEDNELFESSEPAHSDFAY